MKTFTSWGWTNGSIASHYGVTVDLDKPTTGVISNGAVEWLGEDADQGIDLAWEEHVAECKGQCGACYCNHRGDTLDGATGHCDCSVYMLERRGVNGEHPYWATDEHEHCGPQERGTVLAGSWKKGADGKYEPDPDAPGAEYAAIVGEVYTQVVWSKTVVRVRSLCSPCYPGQADVDRDKVVEEGGYLAYDLPSGMYGDDDTTPRRRNNG